MAKFIEAYNTLTGDKVTVPESYVDLFSNIERTPKGKSTNTKKEG